MEDHIKAKFVNKLRDAAIKYKNCQCLREVLSSVVKEFIPKVDCNKCSNKEPKIKSMCYYCIHNNESLSNDYFEEK